MSSSNYLSRKQNVHVLFYSFAFLCTLKKLHYTAIKWIKGYVLLFNLYWFQLLGKRKYINYTQWSADADDTFTQLHTQRYRYMFCTVFCFPYLCEILLTSSSFDFHIFTKYSVIKAVGIQVQIHHAWDVDICVIPYSIYL